MSGYHEPGVFDQLTTEEEVSDFCSPLASTDPFGFLASERKLAVLKSHHALDVIFNRATAATKSTNSVTARLEKNIRRPGKENTSAADTVTDGALQHANSRDVSARGVSKDLCTRREYLALSRVNSDTGALDEGRHSTRTSDRRERQENDAPGGHMKNSEEGKEGENANDLRMRMQRSRDILASAPGPNADLSIRKPAGRQSRRTTKSKAKVKTMKESEKYRRTGWRKSKKGLTANDEDWELGDLEDEIREKYLAERQRRREYFKRLEMYEVVKEDVYII